MGTRRALNLIQGANIGLTFLDAPTNDRVNVTVALASVPAHNHAESDVTNLATDLAAKATLSHTHAQADVTGLVTALAGKAPTSHTHAEADITGLVTDLAGKAASVHTHTSSQISDATANGRALKKLEALPSTEAVTSGKTKTLGHLKLTVLHPESGGPRMAGGDTEVKCNTVYLHLHERFLLRPLH